RDRRPNVHGQERKHLRRRGHGHVRRPRRHPHDRTPARQARSLDLRQVNRRAGAVVAIAALVTAFAAAPARADGDPASDYLLNQNIFVTYDAPSTQLTLALQRATDAVYAAGDRIKVALIFNAADLGAIPSMFDKPSDYARFLGIELGLWYAGPLLVV